MPVTYVDVVNSSAKAERTGAQFLQPEIDERLARAIALFKATDPDLWVGPQIGDGHLLVGHSELAGPLVRAAIDAHLQDGLELRISMAIGDLTWWPAPQAWKPTARPSGSVINFAARLRDLPEAVRGIAINQGLYEALVDHEPLRELFHEAEALFKGWTYPQKYWVLSLRQERRRLDTSVLDECKGLREQVNALAGRVTSLDTSVGTITTQLDTIERYVKPMRKATIGLLWVGLIGVFTLFGWFLKGASLP